VVQCALNGLFGRLSAAENLKQRSEVHREVKNMEKIINSYETLFVISPELSEEDTKALIEKFTGLIAENGELGEVAEWGRRRLAYPIDYKTEGYYVLVNFKSESNFPAELERIYNITDGILRAIVVRHE